MCSATPRGSRCTTKFFYEDGAYPRRTTDQGIARFGVLVNPSGEVYEYSNLGYGILDRIAE